MTDYPTYTNRRATLDQIRRSATFRGMHPTMRTRVASIIEASDGTVGLGQGLRPATQQLQLFLSRHVPDPNGRYRYDGRRWSRRPGVAAAAPPGSSMHEIGLAADLVGDLAWVGKHAAGHSLQTFADVNDEPWHVQPSELPRGRSSYERNATWGLPPWDGTAATPDPTPSSTGQPEPVGLTPAYRARPGDTGPAVDVLIEALIARRLVDDATESRDGRYDAEDRGIVESFQAAEGLVVDGLVGPQTWSRLLRPVTPGDEGPDVRVLQTTLIGRALIRGTAANRDGVYGSATQQVVERFQRVAGLGVDGIVGPATWTALIGEKRRVEVVTRGGPPGDLAGVDEPDLDDIDLLAVLDGRPCE